MDAELTLLRWVLGAAAPDGPGLEGEALLRAIEAHGIAGRVECRLAGGRPGWVSERVAEGVRELAAASRERMDAQVALVAELAAACRDPADLLPIKGFGAHLLTGDACAIRHSVDVDLLAADPDEAAAVLGRAGFAPGAKAASPHELWNVERDGWKIELHRHLPCWSYAERVGPADLDPAAHPGTWTQAGAIVRRGIVHGDVAGGSVAAAGGRVRVPGVEATLVITCAHAFRDFMSLATLYNRFRPRVRLAVAAEMVALARHPGFRPAAFLDLAERLGAAGAVAWAAELLERSVGAAPWPGGARPGAWPRHLWADFAAALDLPVTGAYRAGLPLGAVVRGVGCAETPAGRQPLARSLVQGPAPPDLAVDVAAAGDRLRVRLEARHAGALARGVERFRVELGTHAVEWDLDAATGAGMTRETLASGSVRSAAGRVEAGAYALPGLAGAGAVRVGELGWTAELAFPLEELRPAAGVLPLAVGACRLGPDGSPLSSRYAPLLVRL
jgi:Uncharacterised nucleotidyltransferase